MNLRVPVTATNIVEWVRRAAGAINGLLALVGPLDERATALEAFQSTATPELADLDARTASLEGFVADPSGTFHFTPMALPGSPSAGTTVLDVADGIVKTFANGVWNSHY